MEIREARHYMLYNNLLTVLKQNYINSRYMVWNDIADVQISVV
jgi:hypothetical protein